MEVCAWSPNLTQERADEAGVKFVSKEELFRTSDFVSVHIVLATSTTNLIGAKELELMKPSATNSGAVMKNPANIMTCGCSTLSRR